MVSEKRGCPKRRQHTSTGATRTGFEPKSLAQISRHVGNFPTARKVDLAEPSSNTPPFFSTTANNLEDTFIPLSLAWTALSAGMCPHTSRTRLRLAHVHPFADDHARNECARELYLSRTCPHVRRPRLPDAKKLSSENRRTGTGPNARSHDIRPSQKCFKRQGMGVCGRILCDGGVGEGECGWRKLGVQRKSRVQRGEGRDRG